MPTVRFEDDDLEVEVEIGANLRDAAETESASISFGCDQGICGTCLVDLVEGGDNLSDSEEVEEETLQAMGAEEGQRLACQCRVEGDITVKNAL